MVSEGKSCYWMQSPTPVIAGRQRGEAKYFPKISGFARPKPLTLDSLGLCGATPGEPHPCEDVRTMKPREDPVVCVCSTDWSWVKPGQNSFSRHGGKEDITAGTGMLLNGVFDTQDQELFKTPPVLVYPAGFCQAFRAAEIQRSLWWGLWCPRGCAGQPHQRPGEGNSQGSVGPELGDGQGWSLFCCCDLCCEQRDVT